MSETIKLTDKEEAYVQAYVMQGMSKADAYRTAYNVTTEREETVWVEAVKISKRPKVAQRISELVAAKREASDAQLDMSVRKLMETYVAISAVDPNELTQVRQFCCRYCYGENNLYHWREREFLKACDEAERANQPLPDIAGGFGFKQALPPNPECDECQGNGETRVVALDTTRLSPGAKLLYRGAQQTKDGVKVLFADKDKALDQIGRMLGAFDDKLRVDFTGKTQTLTLTTDDPAEAAKAYQQMLDAKPK